MLEIKGKQRTNMLDTSMRKGSSWSWSNSNRMGRMDSGRDFKNTTS